ncbi:tetratricopeptide repeat protein [Luteolibacter pohnpeiensis]|uniref:Tetratricopeptide repeat protein n=1 Tax=Luteolibacter pohnpeiensis TaxID=454153 RepID=A0A934S5F3_9BACT|nr:tetratricopeptide repeat protein [Luteolibacter pohnpeiensis]MBK1883435.1 tetratricopeptide repeat protein [Luteolibacter pohnpeiensis]
MKLWFIAWLATFTLAAAKEIPSVEEAIPPCVKALQAPTHTEFPQGIKMAVTAKNDHVQAEVLEGLNHLHSGWEFEASRHFAVAMREDPDCLLATWGMVMSLLAPSPETNPARDAAAERLLYLVDEGKGNELERGYAYGMIKYLREGSKEAANAFYKVAERFPNDLQAAIFSSLFGRGGYDDFDEATPDQKNSEKILEGLIAKNPENPIPLHALLLIRAEAPDLTDSLPLARKLCQLKPGYAPYYHLLGHYEWRCGHHAQAASAFGKASSLYSQWMKDNKVSVADAPQWVRSECYRIVALASKGDFDTAYAAAKQLAATSSPADRMQSAGVHMLYWEAKTLPARLLMRRGLPGTTAEALQSLPKPDDLKKITDKSLAFWWIDGLRIYLDAKRLLEAEQLQQAMQTAAVLAQHGSRMSKMQEASNHTGERSEWTKSLHALEILATELKGRDALAGPESAHGSAFNWFRSATDLQKPAAMLFPPAILSPMANRLGNYYLALNEPKKAIESFQEALKDFPNDSDSLQGLQRAYKADGNTVEAQKTDDLIQSLKSE